MNATGDPARIMAAACPHFHLVNKIVACASDIVLQSLATRTVVPPPAPRP
jgi:hypothetical protein